MPASEGYDRDFCVCVCMCVCVFLRASWFNGARFRTLYIRFRGLEGFVLWVQAGVAGLSDLLVPLLAALLFSSVPKS